VIIVKVSEKVQWDIVLPMKNSAEVRGELQRVSWEFDHGVGNRVHRIVHNEIYDWIVLGPVVGIAWGGSE